MIFKNRKYSEFIFSVSSFCSIRGQISSLRSWPNGLGYGPQPPVVLSVHVHLRSRLWQAGAAFPGPVSVRRDAKRKAKVSGGGGKGRG